MSNVHIVPRGTIKAIHISPNFHASIFQRFFHIFGVFPRLALLPLWVATGESPVLLRPLDRYNPDFLVVCYCPILVTTTGIAVVAYGDGFFIEVSTTSAFTFLPFSSAREPPPASPTTQTTCPCRDLSFETTPAVIAAGDVATPGGNSRSFWLFFYQPAAGHCQSPSTPCSLSPGPSILTGGDPSLAAFGDSQRWAPLVHLVLFVSTGLPEPVLVSVTRPS